MTGELFLTYVRNFHWPTLSPGDLAISDNLSAHHVAVIRKATEESGAIFKPLPPYSSVRT